MSSIIGTVVSLAVFLLMMGLVALLFWAGYRAAARMTQNEGWRIVLTIVFGIIFNVALATAAVAGCFLLLGTSNWH